MIDASSILLAFIWPGGYEWVILLVLGLLIFGRRLPEVGRSLGKGIVEFKKGIKGIEDEIETESSKPAPRIAEDTKPRIPDTPAAPSRSEVHEASVGGETSNPYAPREEPPQPG